MSDRKTIYEHEQSPLSPVSGLTLAEELLLLGLRSGGKAFAGLTDTLAEATLVDLILHRKIRTQAGATLIDTGAELAGHPLAAYQSLLHEEPTFKEWAFKLPRRIAEITAKLLYERGLTMSPQLKRGIFRIKKWPQLTGAGEQLAQDLRAQYSAILEQDRRAMPAEALLLDIALKRLKPAIFARSGAQLGSATFGEERPVWTQITELAVEVQEARGTLTAAYTADQHVI